MVLSSNIWSLADRDANFRAQSSAQEMAERLGVEEFFRATYPNLCWYAYAFCECGFTSTI